MMDKKEDNLGQLFGFIFSSDQSIEPSLGGTMTAHWSPSVTFVFLPEHDADSHQALHKWFLNTRTEVDREHFFL